MDAAAHPKRRRDEIPSGDPERGAAPPADELVYLGLGSNLGDSIGAFVDALSGLGEALAQLVISPLYRSAPVVRPGGATAPQPEYWNLVARGRCRSDGPSPRQLLRQAQRLEAATGRRRGPRRDAPRPLDIDVLLFGQRRRETAELTLPHPRLRQRRFVLAPLADLDPELELPPDGLSVADALARLPPDDDAWVRRVPTPAALRPWR